MNKKIPIIISSVLLILALILFFTKPEETKKPIINEPGHIIDNEINYDALIIDNISIWGNNAGKWYILNKEEVDNKELKVYINNQYYGYYILKYGAKWNLFDKNNKFIDYEGSLLAHSEDLNLHVNNYQYTDLNMEDINQIKEILNYNISIENTNSEKVEIDLNADGLLDKIIKISNLNSEIYEEKYFNLLYVIMDNKTYILIKDYIDAKDVLKEPRYNIRYIVNFDNSVISNLIIQKGYFSNAGETGNILYRFDNNEFIKVIED